MTKIRTASKVCEVCGKEFSCNAENGNCWCFDLQLKAETLQKLKENYQDCLCPTCLKPEETADRHDQDRFDFC
ncbi:MAG: cysteine-rich CWC family protein [Pyrinomonadaceae bacterium]|nr:cysteine-rich CWC family protein [Pyrinomonadaceae bacterium]